MASLNSTNDNNITSIDNQMDEEQGLMLPLRSRTKSNVTEVTSRSSCCIWIYMIFNFLIKCWRALNLKNNLLSDNNRREASRRTLHRVISSVKLFKSKQEPPVKLKQPQLEVPLLSSSGHHPIDANNNIDGSLDDSCKICIVPEKSNVPRILTHKMMSMLIQQSLPLTLKFKKWKRIYSVSRDGDSFYKMMDCVKNYKDTVLVVNSSGNIFGGYASTAWNHQKGSNFYGNGQSFLYRFHYTTTTRNFQLQVYKWTGKNQYIQLCDPAHTRIAFGGAGVAGTFGLCIEDSFTRGTTGTCETFNNQPLTEDSSEGRGFAGDFDVLDLEIYGFDDMF